MSALIAHYDYTPFWIFASTNKDDLECRIQLKVRMSHGLFADGVDTSLASLLYSCTTEVKCTISERAEKDVCSRRALSAAAELV